MARRTVTIARYMLPGGLTGQDVTVTFTLVNSAGIPIDGYRADDSQGIINTLSVLVEDEAQTVDLTPTTEIYPESYWQVRVKLGRKTVRVAAVQLGTGGDLTIPELLALDPAPGYWDIIDNRLLPDPTGRADQAIGLNIISEQYVIGDAPAGSGTVTSVAISGLEGITVSGSPITSAGTITLGLDPGSIPAGETGPAGADGADGADGLSAYDIAVAEGFSGDEAAWLSALVGADGAPGADGAQGLQGDTGPAGPQGEAGPTGPQGATGPQGDAGPQGPEGPSAVSTDAGQVLSIGTDSLIYYNGGTGGHDPVTVADTSTVNLTLDGQQISAVVIPGAIDATALLNGPEANATADQTGAEIEGLLDAQLGGTDWKTGVTLPPSDDNYYAMRNGVWINITNKIINP